MTGHNVTVDDSSPLVVYRDPGLWADSPRTDPDYSGYFGPSQASNTFHSTNASTSVDFFFNGSAIYVFGSMGPTHGPFTITLTRNQNTGAFAVGGFVPVVMSVTSTGFHTGLTVFRQLLYNCTGLDQSASHSITITNSGEGEFILDYFIVETEVGGPNSTVKEFTLDDTSPAFTYQGRWSTDFSDYTSEERSVLFVNGTQHMTSDVGAQAILTFRGSGASIYGRWIYGGFWVQVDNGRPITVQDSNVQDPSSDSLPKELLFTADGLDEDMHTITLINSRAAPLNIDFAIVSTTAPDNLDGIATPSSTDQSKYNGTDPITPRPGLNIGNNRMFLTLVIGGVLGAALFLAIVTIGILLWKHHRKRGTAGRMDLPSDSGRIDPWRLDGQIEVLDRNSKSNVTMSSMSSLSVQEPQTPLSTAYTNTTPGTSARYQETSPLGSVSNLSPLNTNLQAGEPTSPRRASDAGVTLLRSGTAITLPPLYDPQWCRSQSQGELS